MNHRDNRDPDIGLLKMVDRLKNLFKCPFSPDGFMTFLHPVQTDLNFMDTKLFRSLFRNQRAVRKQDGTKWILSQNLIDLPELGMEQRFSAGEEKP